MLRDVVLVSDARLVLRGRNRTRRTRSCRGSSACRWRSSSILGSYGCRFQALFGNRRGTHVCVSGSHVALAELRASPALAPSFFFSGIFVFRQALKLGLNLCQHVACLANTLFGSLMVWGWKAPRMVPLEACRWPVGFIVVAKVTLEPTAIAAGFGFFAALDVGSLPGMLLEAVGKVLKHRLCFFGLRA